jgi:hypothetical protein
MYEAKFAGGARTAVADSQARDRVSRAIRGRPERLVETVVRAATATATVNEREAVVLAQRYAVATALRMGLPTHESEVLRMLVARDVAGRLSDSAPNVDQSLAAMVLDGLASEWAQIAPQSAALGQVIVSAAVELAWLQLPPPIGAGCGTDEALSLLAERRRLTLEAAVVQELQQAARNDVTWPPNVQRAA